jgi:hypothetical protein
MSEVKGVELSALVLRVPLSLSICVFIETSLTGMFGKREDVPINEDEGLRTHVSRGVSV